jgi:hypothetical protein
VKKKSKYSVTVVIDVPHYTEVEVEATSQKEANRIVSDSFIDDNFDSPFYTEVDEWSSDWSGADNLRVAKY